MFKGLSSASIVTEKGVWQWQTCGHLLLEAYSAGHALPPSTTMPSPRFPGPAKAGSPWGERRGWAGWWGCPGKGPDSLPRPTDPDSGGLEQGALQWNGLHVILGCPLLHRPHDLWQLCALQPARCHSSGGLPNGGNPLPAAVHFQEELAALLEWRCPGRFCRKCPSDRLGD